jgi:hypothetical protein
MIAHRAALAPTTATLKAALGLALGSAVLAALPAPASAQIADDVVLNIMRECARIDDPTARLGCYDNNIRSAGANPRNTVPGEVRVQGGGGAPLVQNGAAGGATGFGREDVRTPERFNTPAGEVEEVTARVTAVTQRQQGIYMVTLEGGAQWLFVQGVDVTFAPPRVGSTVEIRRGAMDSFLLRYNNQPSVRVRRVN